MSAPSRLVSLLHALIEIGGGLADKSAFPERSLTPEQELRDGVRRLLDTLDLRTEGVFAWSRRVERMGTTPELRRILHDVAPALHGFSVGAANRPATASGVFVPIVLGQAAWDLCFELDRLTPPVPVYLKTALQRIWPKRPVFPTLERLSITNFRCIPSANVPLRPLTVLIGPNDSGKSTFLSALDYVIAGRPVLATDRWQHNPRLQVTITGHSAVGEVRNGPEGFGGHTGYFRPVELFRLPSEGVQLETGGSRDDAGVPDVRHDGTGVAAYFDYLLRKDRPRFDEVVAALRRSVPGLEDVNVTTPVPERRKIELFLEGGVSLPADLASSGVRLLLFFLALAYHPSPPRTILIEEPESGLHPKRLAEVVRLLKSVSRGEFGGTPAQVVLTTHSPYLLDLVDLTEDQVLVFRRNEDGSRSVQPADEARLRTFLDEFKLGEVWFNQGEEGLVARKP